MKTHAVVLLVVLFVIALPMRFANADYKKLLKRGATIKEVEALYAQYAGKVLGATSGDHSRVIEALAGGSDFKESFMLACLSNGWVVRAIDVDHEYLPPSGIWAFSKKRFGGLVRQYPANCKTIDCVDVADLGNFKVKSMKVGPGVVAQVFSDRDFSGEHRLVRGSRPTMDFKPNSLKLRTPPRLDYLTLSDYSESNGSVSFRVHIGGANLDDKAVLFTGESQLPDSRVELRMDNSSWLGLGRDEASAGYLLDPTYFAYPIYHYDSISAEVKGVNVGDSLVFKAQNPDAQSSNVLKFKVPAPSNLDSDGDGLLDRWETEGVDGLDLPGMGANPHRKDLFVEVDRMVVPGRVWSEFSERAYPRREIFADIQTMFRQSPMINPDLSVGIEFHVDYGQAKFPGGANGGSEIPWKRYIGFGTAEAQKVDASQADQYCNATLLRDNPKYFDPARRRVFRYCIFADQQWGSRSTGGGNKSTIFFVALGVCRMRAIDRNYQIGVFTHELGHLFGLTHTGRQNHTYNNKPNYNSLMNYLYTFSGHDTDGKIGGWDNDVTGDQVYGFSEGMRATIDEASLSEVLGVANHYPHDWNKNGTIDSKPVQVMLRNPRYTIPRPLNDSSDWSKMIFGLDQ